MLASPFTERGTLFAKGANPIVEHKLHYLEQRHKVIAHNIANVATPFYKAQDLPVEDFHRLLEKSIDARDRKLVKTFEYINNNRVYEHWSGENGFEHLEEGGGILRHKDNDVDIDKEMTKLARNQMMFKTMSRLAKKNYDLLRATVREAP